VSCHFGHSHKVSILEISDIIDYMLTAYVQFVCVSMLPASG